MFDGETDSVGRDLRLLKILVPLVMLLCIIFLRQIIRPAVVQAIRLRHALATRCCCAPPPPPPPPPLEAPGSGHTSTSSRDSWMGDRPSASGEPPSGRVRSSGRVQQSSARQSAAAMAILEQLPYVSDRSSLPPFPMDTPREVAFGSPRSPPRGLPPMPPPELERRSSDELGGPSPPSCASRHSSAAAKEVLDQLPYVREQDRSSLPPFPLATPRGPALPEPVPLPAASPLPAALPLLSRSSGSPSSATGLQQRAATDEERGAAAMASPPTSPPTEEEEPPLSTLAEGSQSRWPRLRLDLLRLAKKDSGGGEGGSDPATADRKLGRETRILAPWERDSHNNPLKQKGTAPLPRVGMTRAQRRVADVMLHEKLNGIEDKLVVVESMVMSLMMVGSWGVIYDYLVIAGLGRTNDFGLYAAIFLLILEGVLFFKYLLNTRAMVQADEARRRRLSNLGQTRLRNRMRFVGKRFAPHASYWQFVVWIRQFILWFTTVIPNFTKKLPTQSELLLGLANASNASGVDLAATAVADSSQKPSEESVYSSAGVALVVFMIFWALHLRVSPYVYAFQNFVESGLFIVSILTVLLAIIYSALHDAFDYEGVEIDVIMLTLLILSTLVSALNLTWNYRRQQQRAAQAAIAALRTMSKFTSPRSHSRPRSRKEGRSRGGEKPGAGEGAVDVSGVRLSVDGAGQDAKRPISSQGDSGDSRGGLASSLMTIGEEEEGEEGAQEPPPAAPPASAPVQNLRASVARRAMRGSAGFVFGRRSGQGVYPAVGGIVPSDVNEPAFRNAWDQRSSARVFLDRVSRALGLGEPAPKRKPPRPSRCVNIGGMNVLIHTRSHGSASAFGLPPPGRGSYRGSVVSFQEPAESSEQGTGIGTSAPQPRGSCSGSAAAAALGFDEDQLRRVLSFAKPAPPPPPLFSFHSSADGIGLPDYGDASSSGGKPAPPPGVAPPLPSDCVERTPSFRARKVTERMCRARQSTAQQRAAASGSVRAQAALRTIPMGMQASTRAAAGSSGRSTDPSDGSGRRSDDETPAVALGGIVAIPIDPKATVQRRLSNQGRASQRGSVAAPWGQSPPPSVARKSSISLLRRLSSSSADPPPPSLSRSTSRIRRSSAASAEPSPAPPSLSRSPSCNRRTPGVGDASSSQALSPSPLGSRIRRSSGVSAELEPPQSLSPSRIRRTTSVGDDSEAHLDRPPSNRIQRSSSLCSDPIRPSIARAIPGIVDQEPSEAASELPSSAGSYRAMLPVGDGAVGMGSSGGYEAAPSTAAPADALPPWGGVKLRSVARRRSSASSASPSAATASVEQARRVRMLASMESAAGSSTDAIESRVPSWQRARPKGSVSAARAMFEQRSS